MHHSFQALADSWRGLGLDVGGATAVVLLQLLPLARDRCLAGRHSRRLIILLILAERLIGVVATEIILRRLILNTARNTTHRHLVLDWKLSSRRCLTCRWSQYLLNSGRALLLPTVYML